MRPKLRRPTNAEREASDLDGSDLEAQETASAPEVARKGPIRPGHKSAPDLTRKRSTPGSSQEEELAALEAEEAPELPEAAAGAGAGNYGKQRDALPMFQRNKAQDLLAAVTEQTDTDRMERRVFKLGLVSSIVLLAATVLAIVGAMFYFRSRPKSGKSETAAVWQSTEQIGGAELAEKVAQAQIVLRAFFEATEIESRRRLVIEGGRDAALFERHYELAGPKERGQPQIGTGRALQTGRSITLLVPVTCPDGDTRTAAVVERPDGFFLDWRSAVTPMTISWEDFVQQKPAEPRLFRVRLLTADANQAAASSSPGRRTFRVQHGADSPLAASVLTGSRVANELGARVSAAGGKDVWLDLYLQFEPSPAGHTLRIAGWVPEKWTL